MINHGGTENTEQGQEINLFNSVFSVPPWLNFSVIGSLMRGLAIPK